METVPYQFVPVDVGDLPLIGRWLKDPVVARWWGDPVTELSLIRGDLNEPQISLNLVHFQNRPFAFIQDYDVHAWPEPHRLGLPKGARSIDVFIGEAGSRGIGHGPRFLRQRANELLSDGVNVVAIDPLEANINARKAYRKAGFIEHDVHDSTEGPVVLMTFRGA